MKQFEAEQAHEFCKICGTCVEVSTHVVLGGGQFSSSKTCIYTGRSTNYLRNNRSGCSHDNACIGCFIQ